MIIRANSAAAKSMSLLNVLHVGLSGSGKTTAMAKAQKALIIEPSPQAVTSIRASNPEALIAQVENLGDLDAIVKKLRTPKRIEADDDGKKTIIIEHDGEEFEVQSICLDDFEEIQEMFKKSIQGSNDLMTQQMWGLLHDRCMGLLRLLRNMPVNFHCAAKLVRLTDEESQVHELALYGQKLKPAILGLFNCVGYHYRKTKTSQDPREFVVGFRLPDKFVSKGHPALEAIEDPDPVVWWDKIRSWAGGLETVEPQKTQLPPEARRNQTTQQQPQNQARPRRSRK